MNTATTTNQQNIAQPIFTPVLPPSITSTSHAALIKWQRERKVYEDTMLACCQTTGENAAAVTRSVKDSFDPRLLEAWCRLRWKFEVDNVSDDKPLLEIDKIDKSTLPDVQALFKKELQFNLKETGFLSCDRIIDEHGLQARFDTEDGTKEKCTLLISSVAPEVLKEDVKNSLRFQAPDAKRDEGKLHDLILTRH
ncbi:hypothetical protein PHPALM_28094 [Phytophthora palmivora]|uniref:Uncharacterized protein n=1 Tax=Phytophthora palmivora TaxID=4796 RepID=A0A2P4XB01_9STRA|nr:hypothetical protein PHPALM_28094 [Phytophthora palmivora]